MHLKSAVLLFFVVGLSVISFAQTGGAPQFITKGKIEFERKTNQHAYMDENSAWDAMLKKNFPKFVTSYYNLSFDNSHTLYTTGKEPEVRQNKFWGMRDPENIVSTHLDSNTILTQKTLYNDTWLISDTVRKIDWKIGTEIRKIAGFDCRKAVGKVLDSIIVIAFYTDEIMTTGGPESFSGLPGMILGVAIPRMHTTWYATKLTLEVNAKDLAAPKKGKKYTSSDFKSKLADFLKSWGEEGGKSQWQLLL